MEVLPEGGLVSQHQALFVEQPVQEEWEVDEHYFCCTVTRAMCGLRVDASDWEIVRSFSPDPVMCRLCHAIETGDDITWRCPDCGCRPFEDCGWHLQ